MSNYLVISADCHAGLPNEQYREYLDPEFRDQFDTHLADRTRMLELAQRGLLNEEFAEEWHHDNEEGLRGGWDAVRRDKELDADGVAGEVIFPDADAVTSGASAPFGAGLGSAGDVDPILLLAGARAHNRWLAELCADSPHRRAGVACVPIYDVDAAVVEIRRARESGLRGGILIPSMWKPYPPYHDECYDPVWAVCEELELPVHVHSGAADKSQYGPHVGIYTTEVRWWASRPLWFLIWSGVFERFAGLRFVVAESGAFWVPDLLWTMDTVYDREHGARKLGSVAHVEDEHATERVLRSQLRHRRIEHPPPGTGPAVRDRRRQHHVGQRLPASRGHLAPHEGVAAAGVPRHPDRRDARHARTQRRRALPVRRRRPDAAGRSDRPLARGPQPDRRRAAPSGSR